MKFKIVIIQPSWDHSEIIGGLLEYLSKIDNLELKIISNFKSQGDYYHYFVNYFNLQDKTIYLEYQSPKFHFPQLQHAKYIFFLDSIHLKRFIKKTIFQSLSDKVYVFNHFEKRIVGDLKTISLGQVPFSYSNEKNKILIPNLFHAQDTETINFNQDKLRFLIVGTPKHRNITLLSELLDILDKEEYSDLKDTFEITYLTRIPLNLQYSNLKIIMNSSTLDLIETLKKSDIILTLFQKNSVYHKDRISGIIPFGFSFLKPILTDRDYLEKNNYDFIEDELVYHDFISFLNCIIQLLKQFKNNKEELINKLKLQSNKIKDYVEMTISQNNLVYQKILM